MRELGPLVARPRAVNTPWLLAMPRRTYRLLLWALFVLVAGGCATRVIGLQSDSSFNYQSMATGGIAVGLLLRDLFFELLSGLFVHHPSTPRAFSMSRIARKSSRFMVCTP